MNACYPYAFQWGAWTAVGFAGVLLLGGYVVGRVRAKALPEASAKAQNNADLEVIPRVVLEEEVMEQLTFEDALAQRETVLEEVAENNAKWMVQARAAVENLPVATEGIGEDFRAMLMAAGLREPKHPNAWGTLFNLLTRTGVLVATGEMRPMRAKSSNARRSPVYVRAAREMETA